MSAIKDIAELLGQLSEIVKDSRSILKAITDGKEYLARRFPNSSKEFVQLPRQMQITMEGLAKVTAVARSFRFVMGSDEALGPPGHAYVYNVSIAAGILGIHADLFEGPHAALQELADELAKTANTLK